MLHQLRRVSQALADGVREDPELTADLALPVAAVTGVAGGEVFDSAVVDEQLAELQFAPDPSFDDVEAPGANGAEVVPPSPDGEGGDWDERWLAFGDDLPADQSPADQSLADGSLADEALAAGYLADDEPTTAVETTAERVIEPIPVPVPVPVPAADGSWATYDAPGDPVDEQPRRSRRGPILLACLLVLALLIGLGAWWFGWGRYTTTPGVVGLTESAAVDKLDKAGLESTSEDAYSETVAEGLVISADPGGGTRILDGGSVALVVSLGKERYEVPDVVGATEDKAQDRITRANLTFGTSTGKWSEKVKEGRVISSSPAAGKKVKPDTVVDLVISKGRRPIRFADWTGREADRAVEALEAKGLKVDASQEAYSDTVAEGIVISQNPDSGTLYRGDTITLVVSLGPELVEVPSDGVIAAGVEDARATLRALGFRVRVREDDTYIGLGYVLRSDPEPGTSVPKGSFVTLYLI
jgi:serine/threonine-protein kinase